MPDRIGQCQDCGRRCRVPVDFTTQSRGRCPKCGGTVGLEAEDEAPAATPPRPLQAPVPRTQVRVRRNAASELRRPTGPGQAVAIGSTVALVLLCVGAWLILRGGAVEQHAGEDVRAAGDEVSSYTPIADLEALDLDVFEGARLDAVRDLWGRYREALADGDGERAILCLGLDNLVHYGRVVQLARTASAEELRAEPFEVWYPALVARHRLGADEMLGMSGGAFYKRAVTERWFPIERSPELDIAWARGNEAAAVARARTEAGDAELELLLANEDGEWRLDERPFFHRLELDLEQSVSSDEATVESLAVQRIAQASGRPIDGDLWAAPSG